MDRFNPAYSRYHAQIQRVRRNIRKSMDYTHDNNPPTMPPDDGSVMIKVLRYKLERATGQSFYIIDTPSRKFPEPIIHITGSHGNLYRILFTSTQLLCSCDDSFNPCKHILHILSLLRCPLNLGWVTIFPIEVITLIHSNILNRHILDPDSSRLFLRNTNQDCLVCTAAINAKFNYCICFHCSYVFHATCSPLDNNYNNNNNINNNNKQCVHCNQQSSFVPVSMLGKHRNFYHVLTHLGLHVQKIPGINYHTNPTLHRNQRYPLRPIRLNQPPHLPQPPAPPPPPLAPPSDIHVIPNSPPSSRNDDSDQHSFITRHV